MPYIINLKGTTYGRNENDEICSETMKKVRFVVEDDGRLNKEGTDLLLWVLKEHYKSSTIINVESKWVQGDKNDRE